ncbi:MAG: hypothetical protein NTV23_04595 [Propionibacteriales bacterium]|nr:hypothetical protein [Propionibacteriales bacterium]
MTSEKIAQQFDRVVEDLTAEFAGSVPAGEVHDVIARYRAELEPQAKITEYLPVLVRRFAREELRLRVQRPVAV